MSPADVGPAAINDLLVRAGGEPRDEVAWARALEGSYLVLSARLLSSGRLVGFCRATTDGALASLVWDVVADTALAQPEGLKRSMLALLLHELRRRLPGVGIALFAAPEEVAMYADGFEFDVDPDGVRAMAIVDTDAPFRG